MGRGENSPEENFAHGTPEPGRSFVVPNNRRTISLSQRERVGVRESLSNGNALSVHGEGEFVGGRIVREGSVLEL